MMMDMCCNGGNVCVCGGGSGGSLGCLVLGVMALCSSLKQMDLEI